VFWVAGDDHDFAEVNHLHIVTVGNSLERITLREREPTAPQRPMYREPVGGDIDHVLEVLRRETPDTEYKADILDWIHRHYHASTDMASAFAGSLAELLGRFGLVLFQPTHRTAKQASSTWLFRALQGAVDLNRALEIRVRDLEQSGHRAPISIGEATTMVMIEAELGRDRLVIDGDGFKTRRSGERWTLEQLREISQEEPQRLSANVLLRPVLEAALLPTLAYIGGPSEIAYIPQSEPLYQALGVTPQATVTRWGARVIEGRIAKVLDKYDIGASELGAPEGKLEARLVRDQIPDDASRALGSLRKALDQDYDLLGQAVAEVDSTLQKPVQAARHNALRSLADVEKRLISQLKKRNDTVVQQLGKARINIMPLRKPQERVLNAVAYLIRYGPAFVDLAYRSCTEWAGRGF
jgi:bacillithiol biosynthesis cysteine-adding enzyme BshC